MNERRSKSRLSSLAQAVRQPVLTLVLAVYLVACLVVYSPSSPLRDSIADAVKPVLGYFGLYYRFWPFEEPRKYNETFSAVVTFADGTSSTFEFPHLTREELKNTSDPIRAIWRQHMWDCYYYRLGQASALWPRAAQYVAKHYNNPHNPPTQISICKLTVPIVIANSSATNSSPESSSHNGGLRETFVVGESRQGVVTKLFQYQVMPEDLK